MKKKVILFICLVVLSPLYLVAQNFKRAKVKELFELTGVVWRLAGAEEYSSCQLYSYTNAIDNYFESYKNHPLISYCKKLSRTNGISYSSPFAVADIVGINDGYIKFIDGYNSKSVVDFDGLWTESSVNIYLQLLNDFYRVSDFHAFYMSQQHIYSRAEHLTDSVLSKVDIRWFEDFFGKKFDLENVYVCVANGCSNNCVLNGSVGPYILLGGMREYYTSSAKTINYHQQLFSVLYEISRHFIRPMMTPDVKDSMRQASLEAFKRREKSFTNVGIVSENIAEEWIMSLAVAQYMKTHFSQIEVDKFLFRTINSGYIWIERSCDFMHQFDDKRDEYKTIADFLPQLVAHYNHSILNEYETIEREIEKKIPCVVDVFPMSRSKLDYNQDSIRFEFTFSRDMNVQLEGYKLLICNTLGALHCSESDFITFWETPRKYVCIANTKALKKLGFYGFRLFADNMRSVDGYNMMKDYVVKYK